MPDENNDLERRLTVLSETKFAGVEVIWQVNLYVLLTVPPSNLIVATVSVCVCNVPFETKPSIVITAFVRPFAISNWWSLPSPASTNSTALPPLVVDIENLSSLVLIALSAGLTSR